MRHAFSFLLILAVLVAGALTPPQSEAAPSPPYEEAKVEIIDHAPALGAVEAEAPVSSPSPSPIGSFLLFGPGALGLGALFVKNRRGAIHSITPEIAARLKNKKGYTVFEADTSPSAEAVPAAKPMKYEAKHKGGGFYDVFDDVVVVNEHPIKGRELAEAFIDKATADGLDAANEALAAHEDEE